ncbi:DUF7017 domain-containing protein [Parapedobacter soli]|uniref:DUF7017 domain-containing protein n=1 Tax=Parapedobacter soli TaxID=416955 RepID=UPI0021C5C03D|nr:hypothetical protein [Parapedobacter soli]
MSTKKVYELRREGKKEEAYNYALNLYQQDSSDDDIKKALSWTLIDKIKLFIESGNIQQANTFLLQLYQLSFEYIDDFVESIKTQIISLIYRIFPQVREASDLSKSGQHSQALNIMQSMIATNQLSELHHESYGWIIYRYIKAEECNLSSVEVRTFFRDYMNLKNERPSMLHSMILNFALNYSKTHSDFKFYNFFLLWNPEYLRKGDWEETTNGENTYKPLAIKALKKAFTVLKTQTSEQDLSWLIKPYETAIELFPDDEWLLREKALLHFKNNELELAIKIYKQLVLELANKHYVWKEFSDCIISNNSLKIGMLSKALSLEKNEDFLGDIHLDLAKALIDENLLENALVELEAYKKHREIKGWKLSSLFDELHKKASLVKQSLKDNRELYKKYIPFAENFAYADFDWTELVLVDKWKDDKGKDRLTFTDGKTIEFAIGKNRFEVLKQSELGQILKFKLHKQEIKKEVENRFSWFGKNVITEYKHIL